MSKVEVKPPVHYTLESIAAIEAVPWLRTPKPSDMMASIRMKYECEMIEQEMNIRDEYISKSSAMIKKSEDNLKAKYESNWV